MEKIYLDGYWETQSEEAYNLLVNRDKIIEKNGVETYRSLYKNACNSFREANNIDTFISLMIYKEELRKEGDFHVRINNYNHKITEENKDLFYEIKYETLKLNDQIVSRKSYIEV